jgi:deoxyribodipyrimidine photolyase-related protein
VSRDLQMVLGNQLFPVGYLPSPRDCVIFMAEDHSLCTDVRHHKQKLVLYLAAMRNYADVLKAAGYEVRYHKLDDDDSRSYEAKLSAAVNSADVGRVRHFEIEDKSMEGRIARWAEDQDRQVVVMPTPMFLCSRERFGCYIKSSERLRMAEFYRRERRRLRLLINPDGSPSGGRWSFDTENRKKLPRDVVPPTPPRPGLQPHVDEVIRLIEQRFPDHPGSVEAFDWPVTRAAALHRLDDFIEHRLAGFGPYEDAISRRSRTVFHSLMSPILNLGMVTPAELIQRVEYAAESGRISLASVEGFVRQVIGWREFVRGVYRERSDIQERTNFWGHERHLSDSWYTGATSIPPLDDAIRNAWRDGGRQYDDSRRCRSVRSAQMVHGNVCRLFLLGHGAQCLRHGPVQRWRHVYHQAIHLWFKLPAQDERLPARRLV